MFLHQLNHFLPRNYIWSGVESFAKTMTNTLSETNYEKLCLKVQAEGIYFSCITRCIKILHDAKNVLTFSEKQLHNMKYQNPAWVPKWIDIHRQTLSLRFETEWKLLLKQRQMIGLSTLYFYNNEPSKNKHFLILLSSLARNSQELRLKRIFEILWVLFEKISVF